MTKFQIVRALVLATGATAALAAVAHAGTPPAPVPEPGTALLLLGGLGAAMWWRKGRK